MNIEHGAAVLDFTGLIDPPTLDPIANTLMQQARANGWVIDGTHPVGSTTAAANPLIDALGWTDTVVGGRTVLTVMYTLCGDANLDGVVNGADLNVVLSNYNKTGMYWSQGDFNYDGTVNGADLNEVLSNYNQSVSVARPCPSRRLCCWQPPAWRASWPTPGGSGSKVVRTLRVRNDVALGRQFNCRPNGGHGVGVAVQLPPQPEPPQPEMLDGGWWM